MSSAAPKPRKLRIGVVGIGRIGRQHALNALHYVPQTELLCVCSPAQEDLDWAAQHVAPYNVSIHRTFETMIQEPGLEAVIIASTTRVHKAQVIASIEAHLHVLCEKPLGMGVGEVSAIIAAAAAPQHQDAGLKVMTAYSRRFDASYMRAKKELESGRIGQPVVIRSENRDQYDDSEGMRRYQMTNPGIFIDSSIHDIDLTLSFLGEKARPKTAFAAGTNAMHPHLDAIQDVDAAVGTVAWYPPVDRPGAPAVVSYHLASRLMRHGFDNPTEIVGTEGVLKINLHPRRDLVTVADGSGVGNDVPSDFYGRYERAFVEELGVFADAVLEGKDLPYGLETARKGMDIVEALQESLRTGRVVEWGEDGVRKDSKDSKEKGRL